MDKTLGDFQISPNDELLDALSDWDSFIKGKYFSLLSDAIKHRIVILRDSLEGNLNDIEQVRMLQGELNGLRWLLELPMILDAEIKLEKEKRQ